MAELQIFPREIKLNFNLRQPKSKRPSIIYMVVYYNGKQKKTSTGVKIYPSQWNHKKQEAYVLKNFCEVDKQNNELVNQKLAQMKAEFTEYITYICNHPDKSNIKGKDIPIKYNFNIMAKKDTSKNIKATYYLSSLIEKKSVSESSKDRYRQNLGKFRKWLQGQKIEDSFESAINYKTFKLYLEYLQKNKTSPSTITTIFKGLLMPLAKLAEKEDEVGFDFAASKIDNLDLPKIEKDEEKQVALTEEEVLAIYNQTLEEKDVNSIYQRKSEDGLEKLQEIKDLFVLQCLTGQRISDMQKVIDSEIDTTTNTITIIQQKTKSKAIIPVFPITKKLLEKYKGKTIKYYDNKRSENNKDIKKLLEYLGFNKEVTFQQGKETITEPFFKMVHSHTARHTFVTICCRRGIPEHTTILATGHKDDKMIRDVYSHLTTEDKAKKVCDAFSDLIEGPKEDKPLDEIRKEGVKQIETYFINQLENLKGHTFKTEILKNEFLLNLNFYKENEFSVFSEYLEHLKYEKADTNKEFIRQLKGEEFVVKEEIKKFKVYVDDKILMIKSKLKK